MTEVRPRIALPIFIFPVLVTNGLGAAQLAEMTVLDAVLVQGLGQRRLRESRLSGDRCFPDICHHPYPSRYQSGDEAGEGNAFVVCREYFHRSEYATEKRSIGPHSLQ